MDAVAHQFHPEYLYSIEGAGTIQTGGGTKAGAGRHLAGGGLTASSRGASFGKRKSLRDGAFASGYHRLFNGTWEGCGPFPHGAL